MNALAGASLSRLRASMIVTGRTRAASRCLAFLALIVLVAPSVHAFAQPAPRNVLSDKRVLFLHPLESNVPVGKFTDRGLRTALDAGGVGIRNQFLEFLDLARNAGLEHREKLVELMRLRYGHRKIDVIITMYPDGLRFLLNECATIFPDVPILALYMPERFDLPTTNRRIIYTSPRPDIAGTFETALKLFPDTKHVYVIGGAHEMDKARQAEVRRHFGKWEGKLECRYLTNMPLEEILAAVSTTPPKTIVMILSFNNDSTGRVVTVIEAAQTVGQASNAPVFGLYDVMLGHGIVGGSLISYEHIGSRAGQVALDLLRGTKTPGNIGNDLNVPPEPMFDWRELKRWNVVMNAVPPGSLLINREYTLWEQYRGAVLAALAAFVFQALVIAALLIQRRERRLAEAARRESEERYRVLFDSATDAIVVTDPAGPARIVAVNAAACELFGYDEAEFRKLHRADILETSDPRLAALLATRDAEGRARSHLTYKRKDGTSFTGDLATARFTDSLGQVRAVAIIRDVTDRERAEEARRLSEEKFIKAFAGNPAGISLSRLADGVLLDVNETALKLLGYSREEALGRSVIDLGIWLNPADRARWSEELRTTGLVREREVHFADRARRPVEVLLSAEVIDVAGEELILSTFLDLTERRRAEAEAERFRQELAHISRVTMMGELTASLAHELNQPLTAIASNAHAGERYLALPVPPLDEVREILADVAADARRAGEVIHRLRTLLKKDPSRFRALDLNEVIREVLGLTRSDAIIRHQPITLALAPDLPSVLGDRVQLQQVLLNLVLNAMDAMGGQADTTRQLTILTIPETSAARVGVRDHGPGIPADCLETIFTSFFTTKPGGMGMGLAISRSIVESHGGRIWAENNADAGATFWFTLPGVSATDGGDDRPDRDECPDA